MTNRTLRTPFARLRSLAPALAALGLLAPSAAFASKNWDVDITVSGGGDMPVYRNVVTIADGGVLRVKQLGTSSGTGRLHIKASRIVISDGGMIDASGSGFRGQNGADGEGMGGGKALASGGGGAFWGNGGFGIDASCTTYGAGGTAYGSLDVFSLGSAGGAATDVVGMAGSRGGHGGGSIILEAAQIEIYGKILATGGDGLVLGTAGSGGGAGGEVRIISNGITWGQNALVSVAGGKGGGAASPKAGGSGGGGLIRIQGTAPGPTNTDVKGGASPKGCGAGAGADGMLQLEAAPACLDLDGDGIPAVPCGVDCDDSDKDIHPGVAEECDGVDNDCKDGPDNVDPGICGAGNKCQGGGCVPVSTPVDAGVEDAGPAPDSLEYQGGCSLGGANARGEGAALAGLLGLLGARRRARAGRKLVGPLRQR